MLEGKVKRKLTGNVESRMKVKKCKGKARKRVVLSVDGSERKKELSLDEGSV